MAHQDAEDAGKGDSTLCGLSSVLGEPWKLNCETGVMRGEPRSLGVTLRRKMSQMSLAEFPTPGSRGSFPWNRGRDTACPQPVFRGGP